MKAARLYSFNDIRIEEMPVPEVGPGEALMKTLACGICSGDVMPWYIEKKAPLVLGHEPAGEIVKVGEGVTGFKPGDRVFVHHHAPCMNCKFCGRGDYVQCETWKKPGIYPGGISEYILIKGNTLKHDTLKLPDNMTYEDGTLVEPLACVVKGLRRSGIKKGDTVLVIGLGVMGILNIMAARAYGAGKIIGAERVRYRIEKALQFGAGIIDASKGICASLKEMTGAMADIVVVGPNSAKALEEGISCASPGGTVLMFTPVKPGETLTLNPNDIYFKDISLVPSYSCGPDDTKEALKLIEEGVVRASHVVTHRFPVEETGRAFSLTAEAQNSLKCIVFF